MALIDATTLPRVKAQLSITKTDNDVRLSEFITSVSQEIQNYLDRPLKEETQTEEFDVRHPYDNTFFLRAAPVVSITSVKNRTDWDFATEDPIDTDIIHVDLETGELHVRARLGDGFRALQVIYIAGLGATTDDLVSAFPSVALACDIQVGEEWRRKNGPATKSRGVGGHGLVKTGDHHFLPRVQNLLSHHRNFALVD